MDGRDGWWVVGMGRGGRRVRETGRVAREGVVGGGRGRTGGWNRRDERRWRSVKYEFEGCWDRGRDEGGAAVMAFCMVECWNLDLVPAF